jgi:hypothetical protein
MLIPVSPMYSAIEVLLYAFDTCHMTVYDTLRVAG